MPAHKTSAWPLSLMYAALVLYASLYPFDAWRNQGIAPWEFVLAPWPRYWSGFDVLTNVLGYAPLGFLLTLSALRSGRARQAVGLSCAAASALSLVLEGVQTYLPARVPSNVDWLLNSLGAWLGATLAYGLERLGALDRWSRLRARWFVAQARGALVLLALWPAALLFPAALPLGLGQVMERVAVLLAPVWPLPPLALAGLSPTQEFWGVLLGGLIPCLLGFGITVQRARRLVLVLLVLSCGVLVSALSAALSFGPAHAWSWASPVVLWGLAGAALAALLCLLLPASACTAGLLLALGLHLLLLNRAPAGAYLAQTLQSWEQGRFIRFHGLAQWLGWCWPYAALAYALARLLGRGGLLKSGA